MDDFGDVFRSFRESQKLFREALQIGSVHSEAIKNLGQLLQPVRLQSDLFAELSSIRSVGNLFSDLQKQYAEVLSASRFAIPSLEIASSIAKASGAFNAVNLNQISAFADWKSSFKHLEQARLAPFTAVQTHYAGLFATVSEAGKLLQNVSPASFAAKLKTTEAKREQLVERHEDMDTAVRGFYDEVTQTEGRVTQLPQVITELPAVEFLNQATLVFITSEIEKPAQTEGRSSYETSDGVSELLAALNPKFPTLLYGAKAAFRSKHPDYVRHVAASLRELFTHVLHTLAPDDMIRDWSTDPADYDNRCPTRRARLRFITSNIGITFGGFLTANVDAALEFIGVFQKGTHEVMPNFDDTQLSEMIHRMERLLATLCLSHRMNRLLD